MDVAQTIGSFHGTFVDANAVAPRTVRDIAAMVGSAGAAAVDGAIIGPPPQTSALGFTRLYLAGSEAAAVAALFASTPIAARVLDGDLGAASALKMAYAAWTKGSAALLLAIRALVDDALIGEWKTSLPTLIERTSQAGRSAATKGWRWIAEMEQIASSFADDGLPDGFHRAAAEVYRRSPRRDPGAPLDGVIEAIRRPGRADLP